ncbi:MAG: sulfatase-like hydrolase/transferase, partial [Planctomycetes bacterium]|nr:sulfatase-like hydrolase/transferase [Planctomycetota bacterium]
KKGYATACVGKWHLGDQKQFLPTRQGFDQYFGIPYSNDMGIKPNSPKNPPLPLLRDEEVIEAPVDQTTITKRYTEEVVGFIRKNRDRPFFVYLPHTMPHNPVNSSKAFKGKSANSGYGDCVEEIDWSTGEIFKALKELGIDRNTLVIFTSDNGAASRWGGSNLPLSGFKGSTMDGGMRVPCVMRWLGRIPAGTSCDELTSTIDIMPTFANLAGGNAPKDRIIDGRDIYPLMAGQAGAKSPHEAFYLYFTSQLQAVRSGKWKLHLPTEEVKVGTRTVKKRVAKLYDLSADIGETNDLSKKEPKVVKRLMRLANKARADIGDTGMEGANQRTAGWDKNPVALTKGR